MKHLGYVLNCLLILGALVVAYALGELTIRVSYGDRYAQRPYFFRPDANLGWVTNRNLNHNFYGMDFSNHIQTDENGYRLGARKKIEESNKLIVFLGDSFTFGWGVSGHQTFASHFDNLLLSVDKNLRVINIAVPGYGTLEMSKRLDDFFKIVDRSRVEMIVVFHHYNDPRGNLRHLLYKSGFLETYKDPRLAKRSVSQLLNFVSTQVDRVFTGQKNSHLNLIDTMFPFPLRPTKKKTGSILVDAGWEVARQEINLQAETKERLWNRNQLPMLHRELVTHGIAKIAKSAARIPTFHAVINYSPPWFENEMKFCYEQAQLGYNHHGFLGKVEVAMASGENMLNAHSGGHFSPEFNKRYAAQLFEALKDKISD